MASCADDDETCSYGCLAIEYLYWTLQSLLGYQDGDNAPPGRCEQIADEWQLCNAELMEALDPVMTAVLRTPDLRMASVMPDGTYEPALLTLKGAGVTFAPIHCTLRLAADRLVLVVQLAQLGWIGNVEHLEGVAARLAPRL